MKPSVTKALPWPGWVPTWALMEPGGLVLFDDYEWDGMDDSGSSVRPGIYVAVLEASRSRASRLIPFLR